MSSLILDCQQDKNAFRVQTDFGEMVILGGHYAEEMKGDKGLSTGDYTKMVILKS